MHSNYQIRLYINLTGSVVGLAIDGAFFRKFLLLCFDPCNFFAIIKVDDKKHETIANELIKCYNHCKKHNIMITGVASDNTSSLVCALNNKHPLSMPSIVGQNIMCVACAAHTTQFVVNEVKKMSQDFNSFVESFLNLNYWIRNPEESFRSCCPCKMPKYIATLWNILCDVLMLVLNNKDKIDKFVIETIKLEQKNYQLLMKKAALKK